MREILFRGKRKDNGKFIYGFLVMNKCSTSENGRLIYYTRPEIIPIGEIGEADYDGDGNYYEYIVIPETVGQYTGLTDKNGKKIFEGDVVNVNTNKDTLCHRYEGRNLVVEFDEYHRFIANGRLAYPLCNHYEWEVTGNIHDNPELLKGGV